MNELTRMSAHDMALAVRRKQLSPVELVDAHLAAIEKLNPRLNAFVEVNPHAREQATALTEKISHGESLGPLAGVPVSVKSSIAVRGLRCEAGTKLFAGQIADRDATLVSRLKSAGAIILGTTNSPEFLMAYETDNLLYGRTSNPWDLQRTAGGSSGGEAAAVAACISAAGVGSDGGGSVRVPAHFSGICALKPTPGRIPGTGHNPPCIGFAAFIGVVGPMARTIADLRVLTQVMSGPDYGDPMADPIPLGDATVESLRGIRVGVMEEHPSAPVTPETRAAVQTAARALEHAGFIVEPFVPEGLDEARRLWEIFFCDGLAMLLRPMFDGREKQMSPMLREFLASVPSDGSAAARVITAMAERDILRARFMAQMDDYPVLLMPVCSIPAFRHGQGRWDPARAGAQYREVMVYSQWWNLLGNPAAVVPVARSADGLPIAVQIVAHPYKEDVALAVAEAIECEAGYHPPTLVA